MPKDKNSKKNLTRQGGMNSDEILIEHSNKAGTAGMFWCRYEVLDENKDKISILSAKDNTELSFDEFFKYISENKLCFKVFIGRTQEIEEENFKKEHEDILKLQSTLGELFATHTTYRTYNESCGFIIQIKPTKPSTWLNFYHIRLRKNMYVILQQQCSSHLKGENHSAKTITDCVMPVIKRLHDNDFYAMDIKPQNIVYCENDVVPYKLIDIGMYTSASEPQNIVATLKSPSMHELIDSPHKSVSQEQKKIIYRNSDFYALIQTLIKCCKQLDKSRIKLERVQYINELKVLMQPPPQPLPVGGAKKKTPSKPTTKSTKPTTRRPPR